MPVEIDIEDLDGQTRQALLNFARDLTTKPTARWSRQRVPRLGHDQVWLSWILQLKNGTEITVAPSALVFTVRKVGSNTDLLVRLGLPLPKG